MGAREFLPWYNLQVSSLDKFINSSAHEGLFQSFQNDGLTSHYEQTQFSQRLTGLLGIATDKTLSCYLLISLITMEFLFSFPEEAKRSRFGFPSLHSN